MTESPDPTRENELDAVERALGRRFRDRRLLVRALTHSSFANDDADAEDNETLEFFGDSILNYLVSEMLFDAFPLEAEGTLTKARSVLVSENHFAYLARRMDLGAALRLSPGEERAGGRNRDARLADAFEAVFAALALDAGLDEARAFARRIFADDIAALDLGGLHRRDPKTALQERAQGEGLGLPLYRLVDESGPAHERRFVYEVTYGEGERATGAGSSKKEAQTAAAEAMLRKREEEKRGMS
jgi:ribonuclease-3